jgi:uncharacterized membrane protein YedE/YeeE
MAREVAVDIAVTNAASRISYKLVVSQAVALQPQRGSGRMLAPDINVAGGLAGGALIGLASASMLLLLGRITGISGILGGVVVWLQSHEVAWRAAFIIGLVLGAAAYRLVTGDLVVEMQTSGITLVAAGVLVGAGTRMGSGCTSGHGVCGMAYRSKRSFTATLTFMGVAALTVFVVRHVLA